MNLFSSSYLHCEAEAFFEHVKDWVPCVDMNFQNTCDADFTTEKVEKAMKCLSLDKSPGSDCLQVIFFIIFEINSRVCFSIS